MCFLRIIYGSASFILVYAAPEGSSCLFTEEEHKTFCSNIIEILVLLIVADTAEKCIDVNSFSATVLLLQQIHFSRASFVAATVRIINTAVVQSFISFSTRSVSMNSIIIHIIFNIREIININRILPECVFEG